MKKNPDPGDKKSPGYPERKKSRKNPKSRGFCINPGDFANIPGKKLPKLRKISNPGNSGLSGFFYLAQNKKSRSRKNPIPKPTLVKRTLGIIRNMESVF